MDKKIKIESLEVEKDKNISALLIEKATILGDYEKVYLLSFHDDGVVWGKVKGGSLITSDFTGSPSPEFRHETLQELRLFGEKGQFHIWRIGENEFKASLALESYLKNFEPIDEKQVLYGTACESKNDSFMIVHDGGEGLKHAFPIVDKTKFDGKKRPLRLHVKHYIEYDIDGCARIAFSRLVNVSVE
jgi:CRISPR-associated protein (TIGR03984 family)